MIDVTHIAAAVRRLDTSSVIRSFAAPFTIVSALYVIFQQYRAVTSGDYDLAGTEILYFTVTPVVSLFLTIYAMVLTDALVRQNLRQVSSFLALLSGTFYFAVFCVGSFFILSYLASIPFDEEAIWFFRDLLEDFDWFQDLEILAETAVEREEGWLSASATLAGIIAAGILIFMLVNWLIWRAVYVETALAGPSPRSELVGDITGYGIWGRLAYIVGLPSSLWNRTAFYKPEAVVFIVSRLLVYFAYVCILIALSFLASQTYERVRFWLAVALAIYLVGHVMFYFAKRLASSKIWTRDGNSQGDSILFLRSFENDQFNFRRPWYDPVGRWLERWSFRRNADEMLVDEFARYGEVLALGQPGETITPFGARRQYVDHDNWQNIVANAAEEARSIVVVAGETAGLQWEYDLISDKGYLDKTVFLFPAAGAEHALELFSQSYPAIAFDIPPDKSLIALTFDGNDARPVVADGAFAQTYLIALRQFFQRQEGAAGRQVGDEAISAGVLAGIGLAFLAGLTLFLGVAMSDF